MLSLRWSQFCRHSVDERFKLNDTVNANQTLPSVAEICKVAVTEYNGKLTGYVEHDQRNSSNGSVGE